MLMIIINNVIIHNPPKRPPYSPRNDLRRYLPSNGTSQRRSLSVRITM